MSRVRRSISILSLLLLGTLPVACTGDAPTDPGREMLVQPAVGAGPTVTAERRTELQDGIAHYTYDLALGPGEFDVVRLHRIVEERRPHVPARSTDGMFLLPGAPNSWVQIFVEPLVSAVPPWDQSVAIFLAKNGIDVWGIDYAWAQVPEETTGFGFMEGWGIGKDIDFAYEAMATARSIRTSTGQGKGPLHLLGFSYGGPVAYGIASRETRLEPGRHLVKGLVAVDTELKFADPARREAACESAREREEMIASGIHNTSVVGLLDLARLARSAPHEPSPVAPPLTNLEFILNVTASGVPHFVAGRFDDSGIPTGLRFTDVDLWLDVLVATRPHWPLQAGTDVAHARCETGVDVAFDDHLGDITVPILYVGAAGGAGASGAYTASLTSTREYREVIVQLLPDAERHLDFGHADLFTAGNAEPLVWEAILSWLVEHRENRASPLAATR